MPERSNQPTRTSFFFLLVPGEDLRREVIEGLLAGRHVGLRRQVGSGGLGHIGSEQTQEQEGGKDFPKHGLAFAVRLGGLW